MGSPINTESQVADSQVNLQLVGTYEARLNCCLCRFMRSDAKRCQVSTRTNIQRQQPRRKTWEPTKRPDVARSKQRYEQKNSTKKRVGFHTMRGRTSRGNPLGRREAERAAENASHAANNGPRGSIHIARGEYSPRASASGRKSFFVGSGSATRLQ